MFSYSLIHVFEIHCIATYHKRQKLSKRKVLRFTGFYSNVLGKHLWFLLHLYLKCLIRKPFTFHQKSAKTAKLFSRLTFAIYDIIFPLGYGYFAMSQKLILKFVSYTFMCCAILIITTYIATYVRTCNVVIM